MLVHHGSEKYAVAAAAARNKALEIINEKIKAGKENAARVINTIETQIPVDVIAPAHTINFIARDQRLWLQPGRHDVHGLHSNALGQAADKADIPMQYVSTLQKAGQYDLLAHNFNQRIQRQQSSRFLLRSVDGDVRGFLSDKYRRIDARPIFDAFLGQLHKVGAKPYQGYVTDVKFAIHAIDLQVYEPVPNEVVAFIYSLETSDFGKGRIEFRTAVLRIWCTNLAMGEETLSQIHLGKRLQEGVEWSERTMRLDSQTVVSALGDSVKHALSPDTKEKYLTLVAAADAEKIDPWKSREWIQKKLGKEATEKVMEKFNSPDVELLPPGNTNWRMSNAISWLAGEEPDAEKKLDMMKAAGELIKLAA